MSCNWEEVEINVRVYQKGRFENGWFYGIHGFAFKSVKLVKEIVDIVNLTSPNYGVCDFQPALAMLAVKKKISFLAPDRPEYSHAGSFNMLRQVRGKAAHYPAADLTVHRIGQNYFSDTGIRLHDVTVTDALDTPSGYAIQFDGLSSFKITGRHLR